MVAEVVAASTSGAVLTGWALYLGCSPKLLGIIGALPFLAQWVQLPAAWLSSLVGRRPLALVAVACARFALLPLLALPFIRSSDGVKQNILLGCVALASLFGVVGNNSWVAWMGDLVPQRLRGRYFGARTALCTAAGTSAALLAGALLDHGRARVDPGVALVVLGAVGQVAGLVSIHLMAQQHEPAGDGARARLPWHLVLHPFRRHDARNFITYLVTWNLAVGVASGFLQVHMLQNLKMGFSLMAMHGTAVAVVRIAAAPWWGRLLDAAGARRVLLVCSVGISVLPLTWLFPSPGLIWPVAVDALLAGLLWSGHGLAVFQLPLELAPRTGRSVYLAVFSTVSGLCLALAVATGGLIAEALPARFEIAGTTFFNLQALFVISSILRMGAAALAIRSLAGGGRSPVSGAAQSAAHHGQDGSQTADLAPKQLHVRGKPELNVAGLAAERHGPLRVERVVPTAEHHEGPDEKQRRAQDHPEHPKLLDQR